MNEKENQQKGEENMNAYAVKPTVPFATRRELQRTPATQENRAMVEYMDSHEFSFQFDRKTNTGYGRAIKKDEV